MQSQSRLTAQTRRLLGETKKGKEKENGVGSEGRQKKERGKKEEVRTLISVSFLEVG